MNINMKLILKIIKKIKFTKDKNKAWKTKNKVN